jgi:FeS assembly SUF system protein
MAEREKVIEQIKLVFDPEIPVNVWDLGLIYDIKLEEANVDIKMSLTSPGCPSARQIPEMIRSRVQTVPGVSNVKVEIVWDPPWNPSMISSEGKKILNLENET